METQFANTYADETLLPLHLDKPDPVRYCASLPEGALNLKKSDLRVGMKIAMGKRDRFGITLDSYHTVQQGTVVVKEIGKQVTIEVTARWITFDKDLNGTEGPLEAKTFELSDCRYILGPWDSIEKEHNAQVSATNSKRQITRQIEVELRRLGIEYTYWTNRLTIVGDSFEVFLRVLKSAP